MESQNYDERNKLETWIASHFSGGVLPPFSFVYNGKLSSELIKNWQFSQQINRIDDSKTEHALGYIDPETNLHVCCKGEVFSDFPAIEWVITFHNRGDEDTPILEDIKALDTTFTCNDGGGFILHRALGSSATKMDFAPIDEIIRPNSQIKLAPIGGRSSNTNALPFFNVESTESTGKERECEGVMIAIGWSGQWATSFNRDTDRDLKVKAGMELTKLKLHKDERIRSPRILLLFWQAKASEDRMRGHNLWRRFILAHRTLKRDGKPATTPLACTGAPQFFDPSNNKASEFNDATEYNQVEYAKRYHQLGLDTECWWIDAGWYEGRWPNGVGNWFVRKDGFPNGLRPISEAVKKLGMGFLLWFEPERVHKDTWLDKEHSDWVFKIPDRPNGLLNLGNPEAKQWLTEHISGMIKSEGISVYRQDFNIDPLPFWRANDEPDRQGITEIRYVEALYEFWDELLAKHPGLIIDNCASGGRRIDLETVSRSIPLWRTDYHYFEPNGYQSHTHGLNFFLPCSGTGSSNPEPYTFRSSMNSGLVLGWNLYSATFSVEQARRSIAEYKRIRHLFYGDYYPLTSHSISDEVWIAYQFHRDDLKEGMFLVFRRPNSPYLTARLKLKGLEPEANYELHFEDSGIKRVCTGNELMSGIDLAIDKAPGSLLATYHIEDGGF